MDSMKTTSMILGLALCASVEAAVFTSSGAGAADIQTSVNSFRAALGANNGVGGSFAGGRREINWDGVPNSASAPNNMPANFFNANSPRGAVFSTAGTGFQVSANAASGTPVRFGNLNANYTNEFQAFSAERLFTILGSNTMQVDFFVPGTNTPGIVAGFGAVFTDVEIEQGTSISIFREDGSFGGIFSAATGPSGGLSFLGITDAAGISRVVIQAGTVNLSANTGDNLQDLEDAVAMDDFIYGEPVAAGSAVPEPSTIALTLAGVVAIVRLRRR
jgi:hypothetical protein